METFVCLSAKNVADETKGGITSILRIIKNFLLKQWRGEFPLQDKWFETSTEDLQAEAVFRSGFCKARSAGEKTNNYCLPWAFWFERNFSLRFPNELQPFWAFQKRTKLSQRKSKEKRNSPSRWRFSSDFLVFSLSSGRFSFVETLHCAAGRDLWPNEAHKNINKKFFVDLLKSRVLKSEESRGRWRRGGNVSLNSDFITLKMFLPPGEGINESEQQSFVTKDERQTSS